MAVYIAKISISPILIFSCDLHFSINFFLLPEKKGGSTEPPEPSLATGLHTSSHY